MHPNNEVAANHEIAGDVLVLHVIPFLNGRDTLSLKEVVTRSDLMKPLRQKLEQHLDHAPMTFVKHLLEMLRSARMRRDMMHFRLEYGHMDTHDAEGKPITDRNCDLDRIFVYLFSLTPLNLFKLTHLLKSKFEGMVNEHVLWACFELTYHQWGGATCRLENLDHHARFLGAENADNGAFPIFIYARVHTYIDRA